MLSTFVTAWLVYQACYPDTDVCMQGVFEIPFSAGGRVTDDWCEGVGKPFVYNMSNTYTPHLDIKPGSIICGEVYRPYTKKGVS